MKVWTNTEFTGHYPVGTAAVVVADTREQAAGLLNAALEEANLVPTATAEQFTRVVTSRPHAVVLLDGNY